MMAIKTKVIIVALVICVAVLSLCAWKIGQSQEWFTSKGYLVELKPKESKSYLKKHPTGFVMLSWDEESRKVYLSHIKKIAEKKSITVSELNFNQSSIGNRDQQTEYGIDPDQKLDSLAFYKDGKLKSQVFFDEDVKNLEDLDSAIETFIDDMTQIYGTD
ncbi:hypothetical protein ACFRH5_07070 [Bacillus subtilis]